MNNPIFLIILAVIIIPMIVGAVAKMLNNINEANAARNRPAQPKAGGGVVRQTNTDMDRFLAEIDRLRKKSADAPPPPPNQAPAAPVVRPEKRPDRPRPRVVAALAEPARQDMGFATSASAGPKAGDLPMASVVSSSASSLGGTGAPAATRVTRFIERPRPVAKTPFAKSLTGLLAGGQGLATAIVLQEILGPPKSQKRG